MNTISVITSQNIELEYELASLGDRIVGRIIDLLVIAGYVIIFVALIGFGRFGTFMDNNTWFMLIFFVFPMVFYHLLSEMMFNGQSLGKKIMGVKVISVSGGQASFSQYLIRWLFRVVDFSFSASLVALISVAVSEKKQRLGDIVAATTVVRMKPRTQISDTIIHGSLTDDHQVIYPEVINLRDPDVQLIKDIIRNVTQSGNVGLAFQAQQKIEKVLNIRSRHHDSKSFLNAILMDYSYLTSRL